MRVAFIGGTNFLVPVTGRLRLEAYEGDAGLADFSGLIAFPRVGRSRRSEPVHRLDEDRRLRLY